MPRSGDRRRRRWRRSLVAVLGVLVLAVGVLTAGAALRGPRVTGLDLDTAALVQRDGTRVVIETDQPLASRPRIDVTPAAATTAATDGRSLVVTFARMLRYDSEYRIRVPSAIGRATGARADLEVRFRTADAQVYSLVRSPGGLDRVVRRALGGGRLTTVYEARRIQRFAVLPSQLAVVTIDRRGSGRAVLVPVDGSGPSDPVTAPAGAIDELSASGPTGLLSFTVTSVYGSGGDREGELHILDPADGSGVAHAVEGSDGHPLSAVETQWIPGTTSLLARADDGTLSLVDGSAPTAPATPAGSASALGGIIPGSALAVLSDPDRARTLDLAAGRTRELDLPDDGLPADADRSEPIVTSGDGAYLEVVSDAAEDFTRTAYRVLAVDRSGARVLWRPADSGTRIERACLSPNSEYLAVETVPADARSDDYPGRPLYPDGSTEVIDVASGVLTRSLPGADPSWCR